MSHARLSNVLALAHPNSRLQRLGLFTLFSFAAIWVLIVVAAPDNVLLWRFADAGTYYRVGRLYLDGADLYQGTGYWQWPLVAVLCAPVAVLPPMMAGRVLTIVFSAGAAFGYFGLWRRLSSQGAQPSVRWFYLAACGTPLLVTLHSGQMSGLCFGAYGLGLMLLERHPRTAGLVLACMAAKPHLAVLAIPALLAASPTATLTFAVGVLAWPVGSVLVLGPNALWSYGAQMLHAVDLNQGHVGISLSSLFPLKGTALRIAQLVSGLAFAANVIYLLYQRAHFGQLQSATKVDINTALSLAALPYALDYDLAFASAALLRLGDGRSTWGGALMIGWWLFPILGSALVTFGMGGIGALLPPAIALAAAGIHTGRSRTVR